MEGLNSKVRYFQPTKPEANIFPLINVEAFLPVIDVLILRISTIEQNIALKAGNRLNQNQ